MTSSPHPAAPGHEAFAYRPDIDGLRAIAVLSVVIFHAGISGMAGGFVGVDVFFVISGYLIGGQIFREARAREFSYVAFYARRVRRILPALFALLLVLYLVGLTLLTPLELRELGKEAVATIFGASNVLFYLGGDYFAPAADLNPLLMTWSLGVEEQFYLVFPFIVLGILKVRAPVVWAVVALSVVSFIGSLILMQIEAKAAFYLLPTRAWELGVGAALALHEPRAGTQALPRLAREMGAVVGAALLLAAIFLYRPSIAFPGWYALLPTLGTVLLIATRDSLVNNRLLSQPAMVFVGKVSYSWYLWHWPLFYLFRILGGEWTPLASVFLLALSFLLGVISWKFVEGPFRRRVLSQPAILARYGIAAVLIAAPGLVFFANDGVPTRLSPTAQAFAQEVETARDNPCLAPYGAASPRLEAPCAPAAGTSTPQLALLGDSHASSISPGFRSLAATQGLAFSELTKSSCPPLWGYARDISDRAGHLAECTAYQARVFDHVERHPEIQTVVLTGFWSAGMTVTSIADRREAPLEQALTDTVVRLQALNRRVILVQDVPTFHFDAYSRVMGDLIPARAALGRWVGGASGDGFVASPSQIIVDPSRAILSRVARRTGAVLLDPTESLCDATGCRYRSEQALFYSDFQHLTGPGAEAAVRRFNLTPSSPPAG